jgi:hypothetical protein
MLHLFNQKIKIMSTNKNETSHKKSGRPKLKEARVPFTTSLIRRNKGKLEVLSSVRRKRKADLLNDILSYYFDHLTNKKEKDILKGL